MPTRSSLQEVRSILQSSVKEGEGPDRALGTARVSVYGIHSSSAFDCYVPLGLVILKRL